MKKIITFYHINAKRGDKPVHVDDIKETGDYSLVVTYDTDIEDLPQTCVFGLSLRRDLFLKVLDLMINEGEKVRALKMIRMATFWDLNTAKSFLKKHWNNDLTKEI